MNKSTTIGIIVAVVVVAGGGIALLTHKSKSSTDSISNTTNQSGKDGSSEGTPPSDAVSTNAVNIKNFAFSPADIAIKVGDTVTWTNNDTTAHTVTETDGQNGPKSASLAPGKSFVFTYDKAGVYKYHCSIHPDMIGSVTVTNR